MGKGHGKKQVFKRFCPPGSDSEVEPVRPGARLPPAAHPKSLFVAVIGILHRLVTQGLGLVTATEVCLVISPSPRSVSQTNTPVLSITSSAELSDETNGKTHYRPLAHDEKIAGLEEERTEEEEGRRDVEGEGSGGRGTAERDNLLPFKAADKS